MGGVFGERFWDGQNRLIQNGGETAETEMYTPPSPDPLSSTPIKPHSFPSTPRSPRSLPLPRRRPRRLRIPLHTPIPPASPAPLPITTTVSQSRTQQRMRHPHIAFRRHQPPILPPSASGDASVVGYAPASPRGSGVRGVVRRVHGV
ncbi:hypothetical protein BJ912DRAFT_1061082 [Pholiota molesta]|nr:hypothetical protein BJ912DRAFT_1061082 [Pholiota molesta]